MALKGDLTNINLADIFQTLAMNLQEGVLIITCEDRVKKIYFREGKISLLGSKLKRGFRLGDRLIAQGKITPEDLNIALLKHDSSGEPLGEVLVRMNLVEKEDIEEVLRFQAEEEIYELFTWKRAHFAFVEGPPREKFVEAKDVTEVFFNVNTIIMEAARRVDEWELIRREVPDLAEVFTRAPNDGGAEEGLDWLSLKVLRLVDGRRTARELADETCYSSFDLCKILIKLLQEGRIRRPTLAEMSEALEQLLKDKEHTRALTFLERIIALSPDKLPHLKRAAEIAHRVNRFDEASHYNSQIGRILEEQGDLEGAERHLRKALKLNLRRIETHEDLLAFYIAQDQKPAMAETALAAADLCTQQGENERARELLTRALAHAENDSSLLVALANTYVRLGQKEEAVARLKAALELLHPRRDRKKIELIADRILKLGHRPKEVVSLLDGIREAGRASARRQALIIAILIPVLVAVFYVYETSSGAFRTRSAMARSRGLRQEGRLLEAKDTLQKLIDEEPGAAAEEEARDLVAQIDFSIAERLRKEKEREDREQGSRFDRAASFVEEKRWDAALDAYQQLAADPRLRNTRWEGHAAARLTGMDKTIREYVRGLEARLETQRPNPKRPDTKQPVGRRMLEEMTTVAADPGREGLERLRGRLDLMRKERPVFPFTALLVATEEGLEWFRKLDARVAFQREVQDKEELYAVMGSKLEKAEELLAAGHVLEARKYFQDIQDSNLKSKPVQALLQAKMKQIEEIEEFFRQGKKLEAENKLRDYFSFVEEALRRYPNVANQEPMTLPLTIRSVPDGARVVVGGEAVGTTPIQINYPPYQKGEVVVEAPGFEPYRRDLSGNEDWLWELTLRKQVSASWRLKGAVEAGPVTDGQRIYVAGRDGNVYALEPGRPEPVLELSTGSLGGVSATPAVGDGRLFLGTTDGTGLLVAVDLKEGREVWRTPLGGPLRASPALRGGALYVGSDDFHLYCVDATGGRIRWKVPTSGAVRTTPVFGTEALYFGSEDGSLYAASIEGGKQLWKKDLGEGLSGSPLLHGGALFVGGETGRLFSLNPANGDVRWVFKTGDAITSAPAASGDRIYVASADKNVYALRADGTLITRFRTGGTVSATPVLHRGRLYVASSDGNLWVFDEEAGKVAWTFKTEGALRSSPLPWGSLIFFASSDYRVYALEP